MFRCIPQIRRFVVGEEGAVAVNLAVLLAIAVIVGLVANASITISAAQ